MVSATPRRSVPGSAEPPQVGAGGDHLPDRLAVQGVVPAGLVFAVSSLVAAAAGPAVTTPTSSTRTGTAPPAPLPSAPPRRTSARSGTRPCALGRESRSDGRLINWYNTNCMVRSSRLNFDTFELAGPSTSKPGETAANGRTQCQAAQFSVSSDAGSSPTVCGTNTGYHMIGPATCNDARMGNQKQHQNR